MIIVFGGFAEGFVSGKLLVACDTAATARNILAAPTLWQLGVLANTVVVVCALPLLWIEYLLLRPVSRHLVLLALLLNLVSLAVEAVSKLFLLLVLPTLTNTEYRAAFGPAQQAVLVNLELRAHDIAFNIALVFFGLTCLVNGYLIFRSGYLPKAVGILLQLAGACYLVACCAALFASALAEVLIPSILLPPLVGELCLCLWLLLRGVDSAKWQERVGAVLGL